MSDMIVQEEFSAKNANNFVLFARWAYFQPFPLGMIIKRPGN